MTAASSSFGTQLRMGDGATNETFNVIGEVGDIKGPGLSLATEDVTNHDSPDGFEEFIPTVANGGEVTFGLNHIAADTTQSDLEAALIAKAIKHFEIEYPDASGKAFSAFVTKFDRGAPVKGKLSGDVTLKVTGKPTDLA